MPECFLNFLSIFYSFLIYFSENVESQGLQFLIDYTHKKMDKNVKILALF